MQLRQEHEALRNARNGRVAQVMSPDAPKDEDIDEPLQITVRQFVPDSRMLYVMAAAPPMLMQSL